MRSGVLVTAFLLLSVIFAACTDTSDQTAEKTSVVSAGHRVTMNLQEGWRFRFGEVSKTVAESDFEDSDWQAVTVPHTWNRVGTYGLQESPDSNAERGIGWYRLKFEMPEQASGRRHFLQFDAVATIAEVWVNGTRVGGHEGAYSRFRFDVTDELQAGTNLIVVKADNSVPAPGNTTEYVLPLGGDYFLFGGIYRNVSLISTSSVQIDMLDHGGPGAEHGL